MDHQLREYSLDITKLDSKIYKAQKALEELSKKNEIQTCIHCGAAIEIGDKFCGSCGQKQEDQTVLNNQTVLAICPSCEEPIPAAANFCPCCGSRLIN